MKTWEKLLRVNCYYTTGCLLDYPHFKEDHKMIAIDLSKQQALDADPTATQQIIFFSIEQERQQYFSLLKKQKNLGLLEGTVIAL